ncbi:MAG: response regulator [Myxococcota bacterium]
MSERRSVLVVDDDQQLLRLIVRLLESAGHRVRTASSLHETLALFEPGDGRLPEIDLALLDVHLAPGGGAAELLPLLQARAPGLEVLLMSGDALPEPLESELSRRGGRFLRKPFAPKALLQLVAAPAGFRSDGGAGDPSAGTGR